MHELEFLNDLEIKAAQIILYENNISYSVDGLTIIYDDYFSFGEYEYTYLDFIIEYFENELRNYDTHECWEIIHNDIAIYDLDELIDELSLCALPPSDRIALYYDLLPTEEPYYDVFIHYNKTNFAGVKNGQRITTKEDVIYTIQNDDEWDGISPIRLMSCYAGCTIVYEEIAKALGVPVKAPLGKVVCMQSQHRYWVILDDWIEDETEWHEAMWKMIIENNPLLSDECQSDLWVEFDPNICYN